MEIMSIIWIVAFIIFVIVEALTLGLATIWFAGGAMIAFIVSILGGNPAIQIALFFIVSILLLVFTRPFAAKYINKNKTKTNVDGLIGKRAVVTQTINNLEAIGEVRIEGKEWTARTEHDREQIVKGETVIVLRVSGVKLIVQKENGKVR